MNFEKTNFFSRRLKDFLTRPVAERAGIIGARLGASAPVKYNASFAWPSSPEITALEYDARKIGKGSLFFALPGLHVDGHKFINDAIIRGAGTVIYQNGLAEYRDGILYIKVKDSRFAMSPVADAFYGSPSRSMGIIGVTGTEGKSTTVYIIYQLLKLLNKKAGFISTVQQGDGLAERWTSEHQTTPEAVTIHRLLAEMRHNGAEYAVLESSSHGLSKKNNRLGDVDFDVGVVTNVTHEHLEFHGTFEQYRSDKAELFRALDLSSHRKTGSAGEFYVPAFGVANADDPGAGFFAAATKQKTYTFSTRGAKADLSVRRVESEAGGNSYEVLVASNGKTITLRDRLSGAFNAGNVLAGLLVVSNLLSAEVEDLAPLVPLLKPVRGRMTAVSRGQPFEVLVDYAHTPSSFETILPPLRERLNSSGGRLICLFGSAGERDTQKRKTQGEIAARYSDIVILADEDPRGEEPMAILEEIAQGCFAAHGWETSKGCAAHSRTNVIRNETLFLIPNRPEAIRKAISLARQGDLVLLLGKGHENSIIYAHETMPYDEISEAEAALEEAGYAAKP
ncbi:MAG: UDP-N-acetylmuramoyl-L-alanyl-D-glutamate--2,6-diaminopimelate ligase [Treponema sp.]|jgi:UDP-N-acetylmuramoyl-L-alanyl-D-glutamate--2,6-diaminopimelate ligase|nr:UDP-N-acetylmuramoyl-L-alanyl-D-glutamate--2,6-diaminopimelate ligase [Treponema sp.]